MKSIKALEGQTIYDIAIKEYGCFEGVFVVCEDNGLSLVSELIPGQTILIREPVPELTDTNVQIASYFAVNKVGVNSGLVTEREGDFMAGDFSIYDYDVAL